MKKEKMFERLGQIDDKFVEEAASANLKKKTKRLSAGRILLIAAVIAVVSTIIILPLAASLQNADRSDDADGYVTTTNKGGKEPAAEDISRYADSEYYPVIMKISMFKANALSEVPEPMPEDDQDGDDDIEVGYVEVTDNQTEGVIEGDKIKMHGNRLFYLFGNHIRVYELDGGNTEEVGLYTFGSTALSMAVEWSDAELYLSDDGKTLTVVHYKEGYTVLTVLDVSDPGNITESKRIRMSGACYSSRMTDGRLYIFTTCYYPVRNIHYEYPSSYIPQIDVGNGFENCPGDRIIVPDNVYSPYFTSVYVFDAGTMELEDRMSLFMNLSTLYMSSEHIYLVHSRVTLIENGDYAERRTVSDIEMLSYTSAGLEYLGCVTVDGTVKDQYSLDEYEGTLRAATTTSRAARVKDTDGNYYFDRTVTSASLFCIDVNKAEVTASVENFAPAGESVQSVRFDKNNAYVCTALVQELDDPVFFFDLSDPGNITSSDTGSIPGFSSSLINFGEDCLLGIGVDDDYRPKVEIYKESGDSVISVARYDDFAVEYADAEIAMSYKSYFIDRANKLIGIPYARYELTPVGAERTFYLLLHFDGNQLTVLVDQLMEDWFTYPDAHRAVRIGDWFYMLGANECLAANIADALK